MIQILEFEQEIFKLESQVQEMVSLSHMYDSVGDITHEITRLHKKVRHMKHDVYSNLIRIDLILSTISNIFLRILLNFMEIDAVAMVPRLLVD